MANERKFTQEGVKRVMLRRHIQKATERMGFGGVKTSRTPLGTRIELTVERPGLVIGTRGRTIKALTDELRAGGCENPLIEIVDVRQPALNANIMARKLADAIERGWHFRRACHSTVRRIMEAGAKGCEVTVSGKLTGRRHRVGKFVAGNIKHCGEPTEQWMSEGIAIAKTKPGVIGVKVRIMNPNAILPDELKRGVREEEKEGAEEEKKGEGRGKGEGAEEEREEARPQEKKEEKKERKGGTAKEETVKEEKKGGKEKRKEGTTKEGGAARKEKGEGKEKRKQEQKEGKKKIKEVNKEEKIRGGNR